MQKITYTDETETLVLQLAYQPDDEAAMLVALTMAMGFVTTHRDIDIKVKPLPPEIQPVIEDAPVATSPVETTPKRKRKRRTKAEIEAEKERARHEFDDASPPETITPADSEPVLSAEAPTLAEVISAGETWLANGGSQETLRDMVNQLGGERVRDLDGEGRTKVMAKFMETPDAG